MLYHVSIASYACTANRSDAFPDRDDFDAGFVAAFADH